MGNVCYDWKFGDMCQWNGNRCVVVGLLPKEEKECEGDDYYVVLALEDATRTAMKIVRASKLLPVFKENTIDGYVIKNDCGQFVTIKGTLVWDTYRAAEKALNREIKWACIGIGEWREKILHYQIEYRNYPAKFDNER